MPMKVCKFGGTSLADAGQFRKVRRIVESDAERRVVVPSAPGRRTPDDRKITDLLYLCHSHAKQKIAFDEVFTLIAERFEGIVADLDLSLDLAPHLAAIRERLPSETDSPAYAASRGEYLGGLILADMLGCELVDAAEVIRFDGHGVLDGATTRTALADRLKSLDRAVVPGFYGADPSGRIHTFSRGGSDITGALVAQALAACTYENWTDVSGLLMADPNIVDQPKTIDTITYRELRELAYMGATVLHDEAIFPVRAAAIPVNIRNTNRPDDTGTRIVGDAEPVTHLGMISGIAGRKDFTVIAVEKALMNQELGFGRRLLNVLETHGISFEHMPSGIDTMSVVIADAQLDGKLDAVLDEIQQQCHPDVLEAYPHMALIATVGRGMAHAPGIAAKLFGALASSGVNIRMIDQGSSEINIVIGVETADFERAVRAIYDAFVTD